MKRAWELIDSIADLVVAENPRAIADTVLAAAVATLDARRAAIFVREQEQVVLFTSRSVDQPVLDAVTRIWQDHAASLHEGRPYVVVASQHASVPEPVASALADAAALAVIPIKAQDRMTGLLYLDGARIGASETLFDATRLARVASVALRLPPSQRETPPQLTGAMLDAYLERTSPRDVAREQLLVLLDRHDWNLSQVARILGIARRTMYLRLDRYGIERRRAARAPRGREAS